MEDFCFERLRNKNIGKINKLDTKPSLLTKVITTKTT